MAMHKIAKMCMVFRSCVELCKNLVTINTKKDNIIEYFYIQKHFNTELYNNIKSIPYKPLWWAKGKALMTVLSSFNHYQKYPYNIKHTVKLLGNDYVNLTLDEKSHDFLPINAPVIISLHGLGGNSRSVYMEKLTDACYDFGFRAICYNRRGHTSSNQKLPSKCFPRHCDMDDMRQVVTYIVEKYPNAPIFLIGFSCGANLAVKSASNIYGIAQHIKGAISISNGYDLIHATQLLKKDPVVNIIVANFLKDIFVNFDDLKKFEKINSITQLDRKLVESFYNDYSNLRAYYTESSSSKNMLSVDIPLLCIGNNNDPIVPKELHKYPIIASEINSNVFTIITEHGGHVSWLTEGQQYPWYCYIIESFIKTCLSKH